MIERYIRQYGRRLYGLCRFLCVNPFDADDLYQETWLKAVQYFARYDPGREFEPWITRICVNTYRSTLRRRRRNPLLEFSSEEEKERLLAAVPAPEEQDYAPLYEAVDRLPEKLRLAVILFYFQGEDLASAARILNIPVGTAKSRLNRARKVLKEVLAGEEDL